MEVTPIRVIHSPFRPKDERPIQPVYSEAAEGRVEVLPEYAGGLKDLDTFSHVCLLYAFDRIGDVQW